MTEWISVKDRLPEYGQEVLVIVIQNDGRFYAIDKFTKWNNDCDSFTKDKYPFSRVTHWMPLPEMPMNHECIERFETRKIDNCSGEGYNRCYGIAPMMLEIWFMDQDGTEEHFDNWQEIEVNFCPFCGLKAEKKGWYST